MTAEKQARRAPAQPAATRDSLMERHRVARARREAAPLGSDEYRAAAEEVAEIEIAIALIEEPPPTTPATG
jgi:transcription elongation GreA/GreB family factor